MSCFKAGPRFSESKTHALVWSHLEAFLPHRLENLGLHGGAAEMGLGDSEESKIDFLEGAL